MPWYQTKPNQHLWHRQEMTEGQPLSWGQLVLVTFSWTISLNYSVCPIILSITGRRREGFRPFPRILRRQETLTASSPIWTWLSESISNGTNYSTWQKDPKSLRSRPQRGYRWVGKFGTKIISNGLVTHWKVDSDLKLTSSVKSEYRKANQKTWLK